MGRLVLSPSRSAAILLILLSLGQVGAGWALVQSGVRVLPEVPIGRTVPTGPMGIAHIAVGAAGLLAAWLLWRRQRFGLLLGALAAIAYVSATGWVEVASRGSLLHLTWIRSLLIASCVGVFLWMSRKEFS